MSPENKALVERARERYRVLTSTVDSTKYGAAERALLRLAPQLATALEAESERADAAEAKLETLKLEYRDAGKHISLQVARAESAEAKLKVRDAALLKFKTMYPNSPHIVAIVDTALAQLNPEKP